MDGPGPIPQQPQPNDLDTIFDLIVGNTLSTIYWLVCLGGPAALCWWLYKNSRIACGRKRVAWLAGAVFLVVYVIAWSLFFFYGLSRKVGFLKGPVDGIIASLPLIGGWLARALDRQILPTPKLWHLLLFTGSATAGYAAWRLWRRVSSRATTHVIESRSEDVEIVGTADGPMTPPPEAESVPSSPLPVPVEIATVPLKPNKPCEAFGLKWEFKHGKWIPLCPSCNHGMGIIDVQRKGMRVATRRTETGSSADCTYPTCKYRKSLPQTSRTIERRVAEICQENATG